MGKKSKQKANHKTSNNKSTSKLTQDGRMPERDGRRLYELLAFLAEIAVPRLEAKRKESYQKNYQPLGWKSNVDNNMGALVGMAANTMEVREMVMSYILQDIDWLVEQVVDSEKYDLLFLQLHGRRISADDKKEIQSWKLHVEDDFFVICHRPREGAVFVQVGRLQERDHLLESEPSWIQADYHEPRVFVVQGLSSPIQKMLEPAIRNFEREHVSLKSKYSELSICQIHTALLPYMGGITYMTVMTPPNGQHYNSPKDMAAATKVAVQACKAAFDNDNDDSAVAIYWSLKADIDLHIQRLAANPLNHSVPIALKHATNNNNTNLGDEAEGTSLEGTSLKINQIYWAPFHDKNHPHYERTIHRVLNGPRPFKIEGAKYPVIQEHLVHDDDACPFHVQFGEETSKFKDCGGCKSEYLKRKQKSYKNSNVSLAHIMHEPVERAEAEAMGMEASKNPNEVFNLTEYLRYGYQDIGVIRLQVPPFYANEIKQRLDTCDLFHAIMDYKWMYLGYTPCSMKHLGIMTFGDIDLIPSTGVFEGIAMTARRLTNLIEEMKYICTGIPILEAALEMQPAHKLKPNKEALEHNEKLLRESLEISVSAKIDKKENESFRVKCGYCMATEEDKEMKLFRCACKAAYYCCKEHQRAHWKDHKPECTRIRDAAAKK
jgi:hypothetical protein